jgi:hypothetical protein
VGHLLLAVYGADLVEGVWVRGRGRDRRQRVLAGWEWGTVLGNSPGCCT